MLFLIQYNIKYHVKYNIYLENYFCTFLKDVYIKVSYMVIYVLFLFDFRNVTNKIPAQPQSHDMYVRYLLIYCLWRKVNSDMAVKSQITTTAIASLETSPATSYRDILSCMLDVLPKVPKCHPNPTRYLMQQKFDIRKCCEFFIQSCIKNKDSIWQNATIIPNSSKRTASQLVYIYIYKFCYYVYILISIMCFNIIVNFEVLWNFIYISRKMKR